MSNYCRKTWCDRTHVVIRILLIQVDHNEKRHTPVAAHHSIERQIKRRVPRMFLLECDLQDRTMS